MNKINENMDNKDRIRWTFNPNGHSGIGSGTLSTYIDEYRRRNPEEFQKLFLIQTPEFLEINLTSSQDF
jgi:hypothetical protein